MESYEEYLTNNNLKDSKESWIQWKVDIYQYPKAKARKRAESQYYPLSQIDYEQTLIGLNIKYLRKQKHLNQTELMKNIGLCDTSIVGRWERGVYIPDASQTKLLADYFSIPMQDLITKPLYLKGEE